MWIGIDDTDSKSGGCTTYTALKLINDLREKNIDIIGFPRLVRLNPNIPWKTRGNGAISIQLGKGRGKPTIIGKFNGVDLFCFMDKENEERLNIEKISNIIEENIDKYSWIDDNNTNPGFVVINKKISSGFYENCVKKIVTLEDTQTFLNGCKAFYKGYKNKRGLIGATGAISWDKNKDSTLELIAYRKKEVWGSKRYVDDESVKRLDKNTESTFDNYDYENSHNRITPSSPCPVLYGIRGEDYKEIVNSISIVESEEKIGWLIFITNQATDDHLQSKKINEMQPFESVICKGIVNSNPKTIQGGHVFFDLKDDTGTVDCIAYEPTKQFRDIIRNLMIADTVKVYGGVRKEPLTVNLEKIEIIKLNKISRKVENPICPKCGKHMKSKGKNQGYKCKRCKTTCNTAIYKPVKRELKPGLYETPVCARRHLSKPLKRF